MTKFYNRKSSTPRRQELRNNLPKAEVLLWIKLKNRQLEGEKFRRQYSVGAYSIDFNCPDLKLAVEVDGETHDKPEAQDYDERRTSFLVSFGVKVVRVMNSDVYDNIEGVWEILRKEVRALRGGLMQSKSTDTRTPPGPPL